MNSFPSTPLEPSEEKVGTMLNIVPPPTYLKLTILELLRKVDLGAVELGLEVVHVPTKKDERAGKQSDEDGRRRVLRPGATDHGAVLAHDLDPLHEVARVVVGVLNASAQSPLALARGLVPMLARLLDLVGVLVVAIVVVV